MDTKSVGSYISSWIKNYTESTGKKSLVIGVSGGIDSAVTSTLCGMTGLKVLALSLPISQNSSQLRCAEIQNRFLKSKFAATVDTKTIDLTDCFDHFFQTIEHKETSNTLARANSKARLRMMALYHIATLESALVVGTGNKIEDFGVGFFTKYGDGGVDISPIAELYKSEVYQLGEHLGIPLEIQKAQPTDGLWEDGRTDSDQLQYSYSTLEDIMRCKESQISTDKLDQKAVKLYEDLHKTSLHKMKPIPTCKIPDKLKN